MTASVMVMPSVPSTSAASRLMLRSRSVLVTLIRAQASLKKLLALDNKKNGFLFCIVRAYSYLCTEIVSDETTKTK